MKSFLAFLRILIVGCIWCIVFTEGIRVIMLCNWHFDIFGKEHWRLFSELWRKGWTPHDGKEWALVLMMITFFPMILTGWWTLSLVAWEDIVWKIICWPYNLYKRYFGSQETALVTVNNRYGIVKRKSYKQIRPAGISTLRVPISDYGNTAISAPMTSPTVSALTGSSYASSPTTYSTPVAEPVKKKTDVAATIDHALFKFDDDDDDFDLDIDSFEKADIGKKNGKMGYENKTNDKTRTNRRSFNDDDDDEEQEETYQRETKTNRRSVKNSEEKTKRSTRSRDSDNKTESTEKTSRSSKKTDKESNTASHSPVYDILLQKGYDILSNISVGETLIDFVGVSKDEICFCLVDKESGDWLADEEMFNGEEPLWFSENSHRISPVCKLNNAKKVITEKLEEEGFEQDLNFYVIIQMANIINADDMFEIWNNMNINVTRINRGSPKEIKLFSKQLSESGDTLSKKNLDKLHETLKTLK